MISVATPRAFVAEHLRKSWRVTAVIAVLWATGWRAAQAEESWDSAQESVEIPLCPALRARAPWPVPKATATRGTCVFQQTPKTMSYPPLVVPPDCARPTPLPWCPPSVHKHHENAFDPPDAETPSAPAVRPVAALEKHGRRAAVRPLRLHFHRPRSPHRQSPQRQQHHSLPNQGLPGNTTRVAASRQSPDR